MMPTTAQASPTRPTIRIDRPRPPIAVCHNPNGGNEEGLGEKRISHVLTSQQIYISMLH
jgi:hypothetical protein